MIQPDVIVVGSHTKANPITRNFLGSVASYVIKHVKYPVTVVRDADTEGSAEVKPLAETTAKYKPTKEEAASHLSQAMETPMVL